jgi:hypothetical protein
MWSIVPLKSIQPLGGTRWPKFGIQPGGQGTGDNFGPCWSLGRRFALRAKPGKAPQIGYSHRGQGTCRPKPLRVWDRGRLILMVQYSIRNVDGQNWKTRFPSAIDRWPVRMYYNKLRVTEVIELVSSPIMPWSSGWTYQFKCCIWFPQTFSQLSISCKLC